MKYLFFIILLLSQTITPLCLKVCNEEGSPTPFPTVNKFTYGSQFLEVLVKCDNNQYILPVNATSSRQLHSSDDAGDCSLWCRNNPNAEFKWMWGPRGCMEPDCIFGFYGDDFVLNNGTCGQWSPPAECGGESIGRRFADDDIARLECSFESNSYDFGAALKNSKPNTIFLVMLLLLNQYVR